MPTSLDNVHLLPLLLLAFLPLLLHLLDQRRAREVMWPAVRFLLTADKRRLRRMRMLEVLLIVMRTFLIVLVVLALLQPFAVRTEQQKTRPPGQRGAIIVVDTSYSMTYRNSDGRTSLEIATENALRLLEIFQPRDTVRLLRDLEASDDSSARHTKTTSEEKKDSQNQGPLESVRDRLRALSPDAAKFRLLEAIEHAVEGTRSLQTHTREIFVFTDFTTATLDTEELSRCDSLRATIANLDPTPTIRLIDCGQKEYNNRFVWRIRTEQLSVETYNETEIEVGVGRSLRGATAKTESPTPTEDTTLRLLAESDDLAGANVNLKQGRTAVPVRCSFQRSGEQTITAQLPVDGLHADDARFHVIEVHERLRVLLVGTRPRDDGSARFAQLVFVPSERDNTTPAPALPFRTDFAADVLEEDLERYRVLVLCDPPEMSEEAITKIANYVERGGGLVLFAGSNLQRELWNDLAFRGVHGLLPGRLLSRERAEATTEIHPRYVNVTHEALKIFADPEQGDLRRVRIRQWTNVADVPSTATSLITLGGSDAAAPWILAKPYQRGKVVLIASSAETRDSTLPRTPLFLPLLHQLARFVAARPPKERNLICGDEITIPIEDHSELDGAYVVSPSGEKAPLQTAIFDGEVHGAFLSTNTPGFYSAYLPKRGIPPTPVTFAVNFPTIESDLERIDDESLQSVENKLDTRVTADLKEAGTLWMQVETKQHIWPILLTLAAIAMLIELIIARALSTGRRDV